MSIPKRTAETSVPIHPLISERWSPRAFANRPVEPEKLRALFEAARWAASSYNGQPWYFIVATKERRRELPEDSRFVRRIQPGLGERGAGAGAERGQAQIRSQRRA